MDELALIKEWKEHDKAKSKVAYEGIVHVLEKHPDGVHLDPIKHMKIKDEKLDDLVKVSLLRGIKLYIHLIQTSMIHVSKKC